MVIKITSSKKENILGTDEVLFKGKKDKPKSIFNIKNLSIYNTQSSCKVYVLKINKKFDTLTILFVILGYSMVKS